MIEPFSPYAEILANKKARRIVLGEDEKIRWMDEQEVSFKFNKDLLYRMLLLPCATAEEKRVTEKVLALLGLPKVSMADREDTPPSMPECCGADAGEVSTMDALNSRVLCGHYPEVAQADRLMSPYCCVGGYGENGGLKKIVVYAQTDYWLKHWQEVKRQVQAGGVFTEVISRG